MLPLDFVLIDIIKSVLDFTIIIILVPCQFDL